MTIEVPVLRLGLAGYSEAQQRVASAAAAAAGDGRACWQVGAFAEADAWWLEGSRTLLQANQHLRVQPAVPSGRSVQLALSDVDRPVAFSLPIAAAGFQPAVTFELAERDAAVRVLHQFTDWLQVMVSQFALASSVVDKQPDLASGSWEVLRGSDLLAVVDLKLGAGVMPGATPGDFAAASWCIRSHGAVAIPSSYPRASVSQVMWQYAQRTERDLLPPHYRSRPLFFRRPPRLPQRQLKDAHLLVVRELAASPGMNFDRLQHATGLGAEALSRVLSALYVVGSITSNPRRIAPSVARPRAASDAAGPGSLEPSAFPSVMDSTPRGSDPPARPISEMTAPLPLMRE
jgi:hypothetical protein